MAALHSSKSLGCGSRWSSAQASRSSASCFHEPPERLHLTYGFNFAVQATLNYEYFKFHYISLQGEMNPRLLVSSFRRPHSTICRRGLDWSKRDQNFINSKRSGSSDVNLNPLQIRASPDAILSQMSRSKGPGREPSRSPACRAMTTMLYAEQRPPRFVLSFLECWHFDL